MTRSHLALQEMSHEIMLTKSMGGTLGATPVAESVVESGFTTSDFSDHGKSFFGQGLKGSEQKNDIQRQNSNNNVAGAGAEVSHGRSYDNSTARGGLYDVFAPPGPIGIVVDTTRDGPAVHSLKRTSPMLGLINPGDLIVALDDIDARGMTAATLTQLMARKSNQKERKITLLTVDN
jgi:C-terminal processing protease CtpA/Prc